VREYSTARSDDSCVPLRRLIFGSQNAQPCLRWRLPSATGEQGMLGSRGQCQISGSGGAFFFFTRADSAQTRIGHNRGRARSVFKRLSQGTGDVTPDAQ